MTHLYLIEADAPHTPRTRPRPPDAPYDVARQPQRPGELCSEIRISDTNAGLVVANRSAAAGLPSVLWATLAVESQRALRLAATLFEMPSSAVARALDGAARADADSGGAGTRLGDYAAALLDASLDLSATAMGPTVLRPSTTMLTAWQLASDDVEMELEDWATRQLFDAPRELVRWEAGAAACGQTLLEWAIVQAARRLRCASTFAHTAE